MGEVRSTACLERCARCSAKLNNTRLEAQSESGPAESSAALPRPGAALLSDSAAEGEHRREDKPESEGRSPGKTDRENRHRRRADAGNSAPLISPITQS